MVDTCCMPKHMVLVTTSKCSHTCVIMPSCLSQGCSGCWGRSSACLETEPGWNQLELLPL